MIPSLHQACLLVSVWEVVLGFKIKKKELDHVTPSGFGASIFVVEVQGKRCSRVHGQSQSLAQSS
jgi:hypothetical protein